MQSNSSCPAVSHSISRTSSPFTLKLWHFVRRERMLYAALPNSLLKEVDSDGLLVLRCENPFAVLLDHWRFANGTVANDHHLGEKKEKQTLPDHWIILRMMNWWWGYERPAGLFACKGTLPTYIGWPLNHCRGNGFEMNILHSLQLKVYCLIFISTMFGLFVVAIKMKTLLMIF